MIQKANRPPSLVPEVFLSEEERLLWAAFARTVSPLVEKSKLSLSPPSPPSTTESSEESARSLRQEGQPHLRSPSKSLPLKHADVSSLKGQRMNPSPPSVMVVPHGSGFLAARERAAGRRRESSSPAREERAGFSLDRKLQRRLRRGRLLPQARLDLHGLTREEAYAILLRFLEAEQKAGRRFLLVITGKGRPTLDFVGEEGGVLRRLVPRWMAQPPFTALIHSWGGAYPFHGGAGAFYVFLRKKLSLQAQQEIQNESK